VKTKFFPDFRINWEEFLRYHRHHSIIRWDSLCNTGDTQEGVVYQIFDFVLHKKAIGQCNWHVRTRKKEGQIVGITPFVRQFDNGWHLLRKSRDPPYILQSRKPVFALDMERGGFHGRGRAPNITNNVRLPSWFKKMSNPTPCGGQILWVGL